MSISAFIAERMNAYLAGGMDTTTAGKFTRGELSAIYASKHWNRDTMTPPPEPLDYAEAMQKADRILADFIESAAQPAVPFSIDNTLTATDADGKPLEIKFSATSKTIEYRDMDTDTIKRAKREKPTPPLIAKPTANVTDAVSIEPPKTGPQTHEEGSTMNAKTKKVVTHVIAPDRPPQSRDEKKSGAKHTGYELMKEQVNQKLKGIA